MNPLVPYSTYAALCDEMFKLPYDVHLSANYGHFYISFRAPPSPQLTSAGAHAHTHTRRAAVY